MILTNPFFWRLSLGLALLATALILVWISRYTGQRAAQSRAWPVAAGSVVETSLEVIWGSAGSRFRPLVEYAYSVGGRDYRGKRIQWGALIDLPSRAAAAKVAGHYRAGTPVKVYYNPRQPGVAVLQPGPAGRTGNAMLYAAAFAALGLFYLAYAFVG